MSVAVGGTVVVVSEYFSRRRLHASLVLDNSYYWGLRLLSIKSVSRTGVGVPTLDEIELRAYEIYLKRGDADGVALEDWLAAEKELLVSLQACASAPLVKSAAAS